MKEEKEERVVGRQKKLLYVPVYPRAESKTRLGV